MSENNNSNNQIPSYDFDFIVQSIGLIPIKDGKEAINPGAITNIYRDEEDPTQWVVAFYGDETCVLNDSDMVGLEAQLRLQLETARRMMQGGNITPGGMIALPTGKRFRQ